MDSVMARQPANISFQEAMPASADANRISPIKMTVSRYYGHKALPPVLTFYIQKSWLLETFGLSELPHSFSFKYDKDTTPPVGMLVVNAGGAPAKIAGPYTVKANFYGWPSIDADSYDKRCECPIINAFPSSVSFHMPSKALSFNPNTGIWEHRKR